MIKYRINIIHRLLFAALFCCCMFLTGCAEVINKSVSNLASPEFHTDFLSYHPVRIAIKTSFASGSKTVHLKRADLISEKLAAHLNNSGTSNIFFFPVKQFDSTHTLNYDYLLQLFCEKPVYKQKTNKFLLAIGWPATISVIAAPLGIIALSSKGLVKEYTNFEWSISLVPKNFEDSLCLKSKKLHTLESLVSASGWGTPEELLENSYQNTDTHLLDYATKFINSIVWDIENKKVATYAKNHNTQEMHSKIIKKNIDTLQPSLQSTSTLFAPVDRKFAVIIGISKYQYADKTIGFDNLLYADDDAISIANILKQNNWYDNNIKLLINSDATKRNIGIALESWLTKAEKNDLILFFWAGHGYPDPEESEKVYFACYDTNIKIPSTGLRMDIVRNMIEERRARNVIMLADTCHAGKLITRGKRGIAVRPYVEKIKKECNIPKGWVFMVGAETDRQSIEGISWKNGAFTHCLLKGLGGDADGYESSGLIDGSITLGEIKRYMTSYMPEETLRVLGVAKHPVITTSTGNPLIWSLPILQRMQAGHTQKY